MPTPRHARRWSRQPQHARPATAALNRMLDAPAARWEPQPLDTTDVGAQARRELSAIAARKADAWAGTRDTDRRA